MSKSIYVGNLAFSNTEAEIKEASGRHGAVGREGAAAARL